MNRNLLPYLRCPVCGLPLAADAADTTDGAGADTGTDAATGPGGSVARALRCSRRHSFDIARQGYVNLVTGRTPHSGDSADMVGARERFLAAGHYDFISVALGSAARAEAERIEAERAEAARIPAGRDETARAEARGRQPYPLVVDAGAGTGRHLGAVLDALPGALGLALDVSKPALRRAARAHPRAAAVRCDTWRSLPVADASAALLLNVFAPRNGPEFRRILRPDGALLLVTPTADHLGELVGRLDLLRVDPAKSERVAGSLAGHFDLAGEESHHARLRLRRPQVQTLVWMGPTAWHVDPARLAARLDALPEPVTVTASVRLAVYRPRPA